MPKFRTFERNWWADAACTVPGPGRKRYDGRVFDDEAEARRACREDNAARKGVWVKRPDAEGRLVRQHIPERGPFGRATEYESF